MSETGENHKPRDGGSIADFTKALVRRLQGEHKLAHAVQKELVAIARNNQASQRLVHAAVLTLLDARDFTDAVDIATRSFPTIFGCEAVRICIESSGISAWPTDIMSLPPGEARAIMGDADILLRARATGDPALFGAEAAAIHSHALVRLRLSPHADDALIAFGSRESGKFQASQGSDLLLFLARVVEKCLMLHLR